MDSRNFSSLIIDMSNSKSGVVSSQLLRLAIILTICLASGAAKNPLQNKEEEGPGVFLSKNMAKSILGAFSYRSDDRTSTSKGIIGRQLEKRDLYGWEEVFTSTKSRKYKQSPLAKRNRPESKMPTTSSFKPRQSILNLLKTDEKSLRLKIMKMLLETQY